MIKICYEIPQHDNFCFYFLQLIFKNYSSRTPDDVVSFRNCVTTEIFLPPVFGWQQIFLEKNHLNINYSGLCRVVNEEKLEKIFDTALLETIENIEKTFHITWNDYGEKKQISNNCLWFKEVDWKMD